jgi:hypothetical protein
MGTCRFSIVVEKVPLKLSSMKTLVKIEEAAMLVLAVYLSTDLHYPSWLYWALFLAPDIGMIGYAVNPTAGAASYNLLHHKGIAVAFYIIGLALPSEPMQLTGLLLFGHSSFDRMLGYGLKYVDNFKHTHLGWLGKP